MSTRRHSPIVLLKKNVSRILLNVIVLTAALSILLVVLQHSRTHEYAQSSSAVKRVVGDVLPPVTHPKLSVPHACSLTYNLALVPIESSIQRTYVRSSHDLFELMVEVDATYDEQSNTLCSIQGRADVFRLDQHGVPSITRSGTLEVQLYNGVAEYSTLVASQRGDASHALMTDPYPVGGAVRVRATFSEGNDKGVVNGQISCVPAGLTNSSCEV